MSRATLCRAGWLLLMAAGALANPALAAAEFVLPLVVGPDAARWQLVSGQITTDDQCAAMTGGTCVVLTDYRFGDCALEFDYCRRGPAAAEPVIYVRAQWAPGGNTLSGPCLSWAGAARSMPRLRRAARTGPATSSAWNHVRVEIIGDRATAFVNGVAIGRVSCREHADGLLAIRVAGGPDAQLVLRDLRVRETGYVPLFNGVDLSGWEGAGDDAARCWRASDGILQCTGQEGPWLRTRDPYGDFRLRLEYRLQAGGNSGVYVRVPADGNHHGPQAGVEVQILDDESPRYQDLKPYQFSASLYAVAPAARGSALPPGHWNALDIRCIDQHYTVVLNGQTVLDVTAREYPDLSVRLTRGFLGLQNHSEAVWFRHLRISSLERPHLYNGATRPNNGGPVNPR